MASVTLRLCLRGHGPAASDQAGTYSMRCPGLCVRYSAEWRHAKPRLEQSSGAPPSARVLKGRAAGSRRTYPRRRPGRARTLQHASISGAGRWPLPTPFPCRDRGYFASAQVRPEAMSTTMGTSSLMAFSILSRMSGIAWSNAACGISKTSSSWTWISILAWCSPAL